MYFEEFRNSVHIFTQIVRTSGCWVTKRGWKQDQFYIKKGTSGLRFNTFSIGTTKYTYHMDSTQKKDSYIYNTDSEHIEGCDD